MLVSIIQFFFATHNKLINIIDNVYTIVYTKYKKGDIVFLDFSPQSGHEQAGRRPGVVISNEQFFLRTKFAVVCPITNTSSKFPLHIPLDNRTKTTGVILTEHMKCLDVLSRNI